MYADTSTAWAKLPVASCALVTNSRKLVGSASASAITRSVSAVESGLRASLPSEPSSACRCRAPATPRLIAWPPRRQRVGRIAAVHLAVLEHDHPLTEL